jgi:hypothetical protein
MNANEYIPCDPFLESTLKEECTSASAIGLGFFFRSRCKIERQHACPQLIWSKRTLKKQNLRKFAEGIETSKYDALFLGALVGMSLHDIR